MAAVIEADADQGAGFQWCQQPGYGGGLTTGALVLKKAALQALAAAIGVQEAVVYGTLGVGVAEGRHFYRRCNGRNIV
jgi:hypothetical protein